MVSPFKKLFCCTPILDFLQVLQKHWPAHAKRKPRARLLACTSQGKPFQHSAPLYLPPSQSLRAPVSPSQFHSPSPCPSPCPCPSPSAPVGGGDSPLPLRSRWACGSASRSPGRRRWRPPRSSRASGTAATARTAAPGHRLQRGGGAQRCSLAVALQRALPGEVPSRPGTLDPPHFRFGFIIRVSIAYSYNQLPLA